MLLRYNKKTVEEFHAIITFINESKGIVNEKELIDFIYEYEYFVTYYKNFHIFRQLIVYHNNHVYDEIVDEKKEVNLAEW